MTRKHRVPVRSTSLKKLAECLGLHPATVSVVLNEVPGRAISQSTRDRIKAAAKEFNYQPSLLARALRNRRTLSIGILVPDLGEAYHNQIVSGIGDHLMDSGYFYFTAHHRRKKHLFEEYSQMLLGRGVEGLIAIDTPLEHSFPVPTVAVAGHRSIEGVTNVVIDHRLAAQLILDHLQSLGHQRIVFVHGLGYPVIQQLIARKAQFTAVVAFNDMSAIGMIRALQDLNLRVPDDVSIVGFDDIEAAGFTVPRLTTVRQPLSEMGKIAARCVLNRLHQTEKFREEITVEPSLVVRESTRAVTRNKNRQSDGKQPAVRSSMRV